MLRRGTAIESVAVVVLAAPMRQTGAVDSQPIDDLTFLELIKLEPHGPDTYVGISARYPWGHRLFGGQVVAQAFAAAAKTVSADVHVHSLHSYFIRPGSPDEPIRFEVERLRDGRSFSTRQVVARQSAGAILNLSVSFQVAEDQADVQSVSPPPDLPQPEDGSLRDESWGNMLDRRFVEWRDHDGNRHLGAWIRILSDIGTDPVVNASAFSFISDSAPSNAVRRDHPDSDGTAADRTRFIGASLDHSIWFHRPMLAERWHFFDSRSQGLSGGRGLVTGAVFSLEGVHVATIAQEVLLRRVDESRTTRSGTA